VVVGIIVVEVERLADLDPGTAAVAYLAIWTHLGKSGCYTAGSFASSWKIGKAKLW